MTGLRATPIGKTPAQRARAPHRRAPAASSRVPARAASQLEGRHRRPPDPRTSYGEVFRLREFRWLTVAQALSFLGDQFAQVAIALVVYGRTGSPLLTAVAYALTYVPPIVGGPLLAGLADLFPRRRVMVACDVIRIVTVGLMACRGMPFWALCALLFCTVVLGAPFFSARAALLPEILPASKLGLGVAVGNIIHQSTQIIGFVAGAAVVATLGAYRTLGLDALTFAISALVALAAVRPRPAPTRPSHRARGHRRAKRESTDGIRLVFGDSTLRALVFFGWLAGFYVIPEGLAAPYANMLGGGAITVGLLMASVPAGTALGAMLIGRFARPSTQLWSMGWLAVMSCAPLVFSMWNPPLWAVLLLWVLAGVGGSFQIVAISAFARALTPETRGRGFGVAQSGLYAVQGAGILSGGAVANVLGASAAVGLSGVAGVFAAAGLAIGWTRLRRKIIASQRPEWRLRAVSVDEGFQDRGVLTFLGNDGPGDQVKQDPESVENGEYAKREPYQVHVHPEIRSESRGDARDHPALPDAEQLLLAPAAVVLTHICDHAHCAYCLSSGFTLVITLNTRTRPTSEETIWPPPRQWTPICCVSTTSSATRTGSSGTPCARMSPTRYCRT